MGAHGGDSRTRVAVLPAAHPAVRRITGLDVADHVELVPVRPRGGERVYPAGGGD